MDCVGWEETLNPISFQPHGTAPSPIQAEHGAGWEEGLPHWRTPHI